MSRPVGGTGVGFYQVKFYLLKRGAKVEQVLAIWKGEGVGCDLTF